MSAVNFSASGTRWRVMLITPEKASEAHVPRLPGPGLLFTSTDAEMRFLSVTPDSLPSEDELEHKPISELAGLVQQARPLSR
jgi:hypothetical protein